MKKYLLTTIILIFSFVGLLFVSFLFNDNKIKNNVINSVKDYNFLDNQKMNYKIDNYTDMIIMNVATYKSDNSIIKRAFENEYGVLYVDKYGNQEIYWNMYENLKASLDGTNDDSIFYGRFWHGYLFFVRFLLSLFTYQQSLIVLSIVGVILILLSCYLVFKKLNFQSMIIYIISLWSLGICVFGTCYQYYFTFILMIISVIFLLLKYHNAFDYKLYFFIVGAISSYLLYISFPLITLLFPLTILLLLKIKQNYFNYKENIKIVFYSGLFWLVGYIMLFIAKWSIGTIFCGNKFIVNALISVNQRLGITFPFNFLDVLKLNFIEFFSHVENILIVLITLLLMIIKLRNNTINKLKIASPLLFISILPFIWILFTTNHSAIHYWMIFRYFATITLCLLSIVYILYNKNIKYNDIKELDINDLIILISFLLFLILFNNKLLFVIFCIIIFIIFYKKINKYTKGFVLLLTIASLSLILLVKFNNKNLIDDDFYKGMYNEIYNKVMYYGQDYINKNNVEPGEKVDIKNLIDVVNSDSVFLLGCNGYITNENGKVMPYLNCNGVTLEEK